MKNDPFYEGFFAEIWRKTSFGPKGGFAMGRSGYLKHEYYFAAP